MSGDGIGIAFMGSSDFAVPALDALFSAGERIVFVVTQPDRVRGRGGKVLPTPVGAYAEGKGLPLLKPERLKDNADFARALEKAAPDLIVVAAYGKILPKSLLELPALGCINIHASLLPEYRGAAPVQRAILDGKRETGVTLMYMSEGLDTGDMIACANADATGVNAGELTARLARLGAGLLIDELPGIVGKTAPRIPQDDAVASYAEKIEKSEGRLDFNRSAWEAVRRVRAMTPSPGAYFFKGGERIIVTEARALNAAEWAAFRAKDGGSPGPETEDPGMVLAVQEEGICVSTVDGVLLIEALKAPGRRAMPACEYLKGNAFETAILLA